MARTKRVYNDPRSFWFKQFTEHDPATRESPGEHARRKVAMTHAQACMGRCKKCKDPKRDQKMETKKRKMFKIETS